VRNISTRSITILLLITSISLGASRVAYTRPGFMMKIPTSSVQKAPYLFRTGFGTELHNFDPFNSAQGIYFDMELGRNFTFGFSSVQTADTTSLALLGATGYSPPVEFGFHLQQKVYTYNNISLSVGLQDIVFENEESNGGSGGLSLNPDELSFFAVISSEKDLGEYYLSTFMGFGSGGFSAADTIRNVTGDTDDGSTSEDDETSQGTSAGVFMGLIMNTPYLGKWGGIDLVGEFDGTGINVGLRIPLTSDYRLNLGFTHIEKLPDWKTRYWEGHPGITLGFDMAVPKTDRSTSGSSGGPSPFPGSQLKLPGTGQYESLSSSTDSTLAQADYAVHTVRDSMKMLKNEMRNMMVQLASMQQQSQFLEDSLLAMTLNRNVDEKNMNEAMRHLSRSLRYFYSGDYRAALQEVESALDMNPNLALAYARRGSIYYKLGDIQRATINWNLALRMDPEYDDVRNILKALHENRLKSTSVVKE